ncbi:MAG: DUF3617 domain-containing protein [Pseudomonadota bacterium]
MKRAFGVACLSLALAACGDSGGADTDGDGVISNDEARAEVESDGGQIKPEPGKYRATMTFVSADIPNAPPEMQSMIGSQMSHSSEICITDEMAERGFEDAIKESQDDSCTIDKFNIDGNDVEMAMSCKDDGAGAMTMSMTGNVTPTRSEMTMISEGMMAEMGGGTVEMKLVQERIGECDA